MPELPGEMQNVLKSKADQSDVRKLFEEKTNKVDTESQMMNLDAMHKMLVNVIVLMTEQAR